MRSDDDIRASIMVFMIQVIGLLLECWSTSSFLVHVQRM